MSAFITNPNSPRTVASSTPASLSSWSTSTTTFTVSQPTDAFSTSFATAAQGPSTLPSGEMFEPILPDASTLIAFGSIIALSALAVWVWSTQVVPVSRTNLALSKKNGPVKDYLDELRMAERPSTTTGENDVLATSIESAATTNVTAPDSVAVTKNSRALERWLFTDWLQKKNSPGKSGRQKEPALPVLKNAKWNSGDNPVLVASALIMGGVLFTAITEHAGSLLF